MPKVEIELPEPPEGYEYTGQHRTPHAGDSYVKSVGGDLVVLQAGAEVALPCFLVRKKRWKPERGEDYYFISSRGVVSKTFYSGYTGDEERFDSCNCFKTHQLAEKARDHILNLLKELTHE